MPFHTFSVPPHSTMPSFKPVAICETVWFRSQPDCCSIDSRGAAQAETERMKRTLIPINYLGSKAVLVLEKMGVE